MHKIKQYYGLQDILVKNIIIIIIIITVIIIVLFNGDYARRQM